MTADKPFPFLLEQVLFVRSHVTAVSGFDPQNSNTSALSPVSKIEIKIEDGQVRRGIVSMTCQFNSEGSSQAPYIVDMECIGVFQVIEADLQGVALEKGLTITAHNVLYGAIREAVSWISGRHINGPLVLGLSILRPVNANVEGSKP